MTKIFVPVTGKPATAKEWGSFAVLILLAMTGIHGLVVAVLIGVIENPWDKTVSTP